MVVNEIDLEIERKPIKHIHLSVYPPDGHVHASVPQDYADEQIRLFVLSKYTWLKTKISEAQCHNYQSQREYVSGEAHYFKGELYRLRIDIITTGKQEVYIEGDYIVVRCRRQENAESLMKEWYRYHLKQLLPTMLEKWCKRLTVDIPTYEVKEMLRCWGSCQSAKKHIMFNLELAKQPIECIDYIVAHETIHLIERIHSVRFFRLLNTYFPGWETLRNQLNEFPITNP